MWALLVKRKKFFIVFFTICCSLNWNSICHATQLKVMVIIPEYHLSGENTGQIFQNRTINNSPSIHRMRIPDPAGETEIIKILVNNGFKVVDKTQVEKIRYNNEVKAIINGDTDLAKVLALQFGADYLLIGEAFSQFTGRAFQGLSSCRARIEARMIRSDTGEIFFADGKYGSGIDRSEAIAGKMAIQKASSELGNFCVEKLKVTKSEDGIKTIDLIVTGLKFNELVIFKKKVIFSTDCVQNIMKSSFIKNKALLNLKLKCDTELFSERILTTGSNQFYVDILEMSTNRLTITADLK